MFCIKYDNTDPYFNLAAEEYLLKSKEEEYFFLYINEPSVVVGKHQNTYAEVNFRYLSEKGIKIARRLTGGGAVYHDNGNLNFSFIAFVKEGEMVNFQRFTNPVIDYLKTLKVDSEFRGKNDLVILGDKISGNAEHIYKNRVLHHGTILFSSDLDKLSMALKINPLKYQDKAVKSIRSKVTNISGYIGSKDIDEFSRRFLDYIIGLDENNKVYGFNAEDIRAVNKLQNEKYSSWDWIIGYSPPCTMSQTIKINYRHMHIYLEVNKGTINTIQLSGNLLTEQEMRQLELALRGGLHRIENIEAALRSIEISSWQKNTVLEELKFAFF